LRAGAEALSLLSVPFNVEVLSELRKGPRPRAEIRQALGHPPDTTMRTYLKRLDCLGVLELHRHPGFPGSMELAITKSGTDLLEVAETLEQWLAHAPKGRVRLGTVAAKSAIKALIDGWSTGIVRVLAARPLTLTELDGLIADVTYPSLERRLGAMRTIGLLETLRPEPHGTPHAIAWWLRAAVLPLLAAVRWEGRHLVDRSRITNRDVEAAFLLALPLLRLDDEVSGTCRVSVEVGVDAREGAIGAIAEFEHGRLLSATCRLAGRRDASITGSPATWIAAVLDGTVSGLETSGEESIASPVLRSLTRGPREANRELALIEHTHQ
jgi:DNA-binding HxlR family transcriptional regulator